MSNIDAKHVLVMVVDDQLNIGDQEKDRQIKYQNCLELVKQNLNSKWVFDIHYCQKLGDIAETKVVETGQSKLAIVDMVLDNSPWTSDSVHRLDHKLVSERWPMILVSARFGSPEAINRVNKLMGNTDDTCIPSQFLMWSAIERAAEGFDDGELAFIIDSVLSRSQNQDLRFKKGPDDPIDILHITDPHFGKAIYAGKLITLRIERENASLGVADFLAITGDIADQGTPEQYNLALDFFHALANHKVVDSIDQKVPKDRVFLCPGNHDFSRRIALAANIAGDKDFNVEKTIEPAHFWACVF